MRKNLKRLKVLLIGCGLVTSPLAQARELSELAPYVNQLNSSTQLQCSDQNFYYIRPPYGQPIPKQSLSQCQQCMSKLPNVANDVTNVYKRAVASDGGANGGVAVGTGIVAGKNTGFADASQNDTSVNNKIGSAGQKTKVANATSVSSAGKSCGQELQSCQGLASADQKVVDDAKQACQQLSQQADSVAKEKAASGGMMDGLGQLAGALGQGLGALKDMMAQQGADPSAIDPYTPSTDTTKIDQVAGTKLDDPAKQIGGTSIGESLTGVKGTDIGGQQGGITGIGSPGANPFIPGGTGSSQGSAFNDLAGADGNGSGGGPLGASTAAGGGSGGLNSSGSSMSPGAGEAAAAGAAGANAGAGGDSTEINAGAGGGRPFLGLKGRGGPEEDLGLGDGAGGVLGDLGAEASRDLASADEIDGSGIGLEEGNTLFQVVHTKISEIKRRGSI